LEARRKASEESLSTFQYDHDDVEFAPRPASDGAVAEFTLGHRRKLTAADLNKPLPPVALNVPFKIQIDSTFSWNKLGSVSYSPGSSRVQSGV
jgi:hypothetical protein